MEQLCLWFISDPRHEWPDTTLGNFSPHDKNYPLPGFTCLSQTPPAPIIRVSVEQIETLEKTQKLMENLPEERYESTVRQVEEILEDDVRHVGSVMS